MVETISTLGLSHVSSNNIISGQSLLSKLSQQLTTGIYSSNLSDYTSNQAQKLLNFNSKVDEQKGFLTVIETLTPRLDMYDASLTGIEDTAGEAFSTILSSNVYNTSTNSSLQGAIEGYMSDMSYYLNQKVGDRYIFSGTRYDQPPVLSAEDLAALPTPPTETAPYLATAPAVPAYDSDYNAASPADPYPAAYVEDSLKIDTSKTLQYGVTSNDTGVQQIMMGLRWAYSATKDPANYETYMQTARDLISTGLSNVRGTHTGVTNAQNTLENTKSMITTNVSNLKDQVDNIENVDINEVGVKITVLQAQLEASYAVTAKMSNLSLVNYL